jgi:site-specific DNA recombinase
MRAAIYARFSTEGQSKASIPDQFRVCERIAEAHGFEVVARFSDAAISGGTAERPDYQKMLRAARRREFGVIIAEDSTRLWRSMSEQSPRLAELSDLGIHMVCHDFDTRSESAGILGAVQGAMGEQYRKEIGRRTRRGLEGLARAQKPTGGRSYGYISAAESPTKARAIDPEQAAIVREIFTRYADGTSARTIAADLNQRGVPSPGSMWNRTRRRTDAWMSSAIAGDWRKGTGILNNPLYSGVVIWNKVKWVRSAADSRKRKQVPNARSEWIEHQDETLRIVSQDLWARVRARQLAQSERLGDRVREGLQRRERAEGRPPGYLLSGFLRCGICGRSFVMVNRTRYGCASRVGGKACANRLTVPRTLAESRVLETIKRDLLDPEVIAEMEARVRQALKNRRKRQSGGGVEAEITRLRKEVANLTDAIASGLLRSSPALAQRLNAAESQLERLDVAKRVSVPTQLEARLGDRCRAMVQRLEETLGRDLERSRAALREVVGDVVTLAPDESGRFLWAHYGQAGAEQLRAVANESKTLVAGAGFEPATFGL